MRTRAAVAYAAGKPLSVEEVNLEGPKAGEVLVDLSGKADDGATVKVTASLRGGGQMELSDVPDSHVEALLLAGFTNQSGKYVFTESGTQNRDQP